MTKHRTTDPACSKHRPPRTPLGRRHHDRNRGRSCPTCMPGAAQKHRIRMEVLIDAEGRWYGWYCTRCSECSMLNRNLIRAWWASLHYRRHGICRPLPDLIIEITAETKGFTAPQSPAPPRMNGSTAIAPGNVAGSTSLNSQEDTNG